MRAKIGAAALAALVLAAQPTTATTAPASARVQKVDDGYLMGDPAAPLKIVVVSSFGCAYCRALDINMMDPLKKNWIDTRKASLRFVPYVLFTPDIPTVIAADCGPVSGYFSRMSALFSIQRSVSQGYNASKSVSKTLRPDDIAHQDIKGIAAATGIVQSSTAAGLQPSAVTRCLSDPKVRPLIEGRQKLARQRYGVAGTPDVTLNGKDLGTGGSWQGLEKALKAASKG